jgi:hypothetical protein
MTETATRAPEILSKKQAKELKKALEKLNSTQEDERMAAHASLDALGANKLDILLNLLKKEATDRRKRHPLVVAGIIAYLITAVLSIVIPPMFGKRPSFGLLKILLYSSGAIMAALAVSSAQKNATRALEGDDDKRIVGVWALALDYDDEQLVALARRKLLQFLPQLNASDAPLLDEEQRGILYNALNKRPDKKDSNNTELHQAILKALQQVGDERALPHVEKLAKGQGLAAAYPELKTAAEACLPFLKERVEQIRASQTLLRASSAFDAPSSGSEVLLRPALHAGTTPTQELLRAADTVTPEETTPQRSVLPQTKETPMRGVLPETADAPVTAVLNRSE